MGIDNLDGDGIKGGQGRSADSVRADSRAFWFCFALATIIVVALGFWAIYAVLRAKGVL